jgi:hypothetical protein
MENGVNLICEIVATAVAASRDAAKQLKYDLDDNDDDDVLKDTVESKSLKIIIDNLCTSFPKIKYISKGNVSCFLPRIKKNIKIILNFQILRPTVNNKITPKDEIAELALVKSTNSLETKQRLFLNEITESEV